MRSVHRLSLPLLAAAALLCFPVPGSLRASDPLAGGFAEPPEQTKPWCYWYWISDHISREGLTRDLEAMRRVGIGEALVGNIFLEGFPAGQAKVLSEEWWGLVEHAIREAGRVGVNIGLFNCPGWSQSGGPWIQAEHSMRYLVSSELRLQGPLSFSGKLAAPAEPFQDVALLAFPAPAGDADDLSRHAPRITCTPPVSEAARLVDGNRDTAAALPLGPGSSAGAVTVDISLDAPLTARSLHITPASEAFGATCELQAPDASGEFRTLRRFRCDRSNMAVNVGPMPRGPVTISFPAVSASRFRLVFSEFFGGGKQAQLAELNLSGAARLESFVEKQLGKMHPTPLPLGDAYSWPQPEEPEPGFAVSRESILDLSRHLAADGTLTWEVPAGEWIVQRTGMTPTGTRNAPASPEGSGLEVDKMNRDLAKRHFDAFLGQLLQRMPAADRKALTRVVADSYEMGSQNWTDGLETRFQQRFGYDPKPWLPVLSGRIVRSADQSERFLWDLRRLVADCVASDYVGGLRDACHPHGLGLWLENYGHWGFPGEFLQYGGEADRIGGEFWVTGDLGSIECRAASSAANIYGKPFVSAESFTGGPPFQNAPSALKARGDWSFCEGVNHAVLHVYIHQPWEDKVPGVNAWFGTEFNRHNTWFEAGKAWIGYERRCCWMLQQGWRVADVAYFIGEDAPKMTASLQPALPQGRDFDFINAGVLEKLATARDGKLSLPHGPQYRVLVLPDKDTMRPPLLRKVRDLLQAGAVVLGRPPLRSPSLEDYPACDAGVKKLATEIWGDQTLPASGERRLGAGRVFWGKSLDEVLAALDSAPDFASSVPLRFTHRRDGGTDIFFIANPKAQPVAATVSLRAGNRAPELWWPDSGLRERPAVYDAADGQVRLPLALEGHGSVFAVFRGAAAPASQRILSVTRDGEELLSTRAVAPRPRETGDSPGHFSFALWVHPQDDTTLVREANQGVVGLGEKRNEVFAAPHGNSLGGPGHAGAGLSVGRNGVCVFEHGANYYAPPLVHATSLNGWTHLAVVYRDGQPSLYLNGTLAHTGLKSLQVVHSGAGQASGARFRGERGEIESFDRSLSDAEIRELAHSMPRPQGRDVLAPRFAFDDQGRIRARVSQPGRYECRLADGAQRTLLVPPPPAPQPVAGPWEVRFTPGWGAPETVAFDQLTDWSQHPDEGIRHYSGKAVYRATFAWSEPLPAAPGAGVLLDLGEVRDLATVRVNGVAFETLWMAPWRVDISRALKPGTNELEVEVVNVWNNRLAGDAALSPEKQRTFLAFPTVKASAPLLPAGLLGPVTLRTAGAVPVP